MEIQNFLDNKKYIGIIAAMTEEIASIKKLMSDISVRNIYELEFTLGTIHSKNVVLVKSGVGKVNAARTTQVLIDNFDLEYVINVGTAGGLNEDIEIGDIVIAEKLVQHDFDITAGGHEKGYISNLGKYFNCDENLVKKGKKIIDNMNEDFKAITGLIATGDIFVQDISIKDGIKEEFNADCTEMEGAAIAQVCTLDNIPFIVIRSISDKPNGNNSIDFEKFLELACERYSKFIDIFLN